MPTKRVTDTEMAEGSFLTETVTQKAGDINIQDLVFTCNLDLIHEYNECEKLGGCNYYLICFRIKFEYAITALLQCYL